MTSSASNPPLTKADRIARAQRHEKIGDALADAGDEWACVAYFYAAYHLVRDALLSDPLFADPVARTAKHKDLKSQDRGTKRHNGRRRPTMVWGVNDLVALLYPHIAVDYELLHLASIEVRYHNGLTGTITDVQAALATIKAAHAAGLQA